MDIRTTELLIGQTQRDVRAIDFRVSAFNVEMRATFISIVFFRLMQSRIAVERQHLLRH